MTLLERYHRDFVRAGAKLSPADKTRLSALNQEEAKLSHRVPEQAAGRDQGRRARGRRPAPSSTD